MKVRPITYDVGRTVMTRGIYSAIATATDGVGLVGALHAEMPLEERYIVYVDVYENR